MKPFNLITRKETSDYPPSIQVADMNGEVIATIWADKRITSGERQQDYHYKEVKYFMAIAKNFFTFYNNLNAKDKEIEHLKSKVTEPNPILNLHDKK